MANNAWLQECPKPFTKQVWGNVLHISKADARNLGVVDGDVVRLTDDKLVVEAPVLEHELSQAGHLHALLNRLHDFLALVEVAIDVLHFHRRVIHEDSHGQRQPAQGHDVDRLAQRNEDTISDVRIDKGIETAMMIVLRQLPRKRRIIKPVRAAAIAPSRITP